MFFSKLSHQGSPRTLQWVTYPFPVDLPNPESDWGLLYCRWILYQLSYWGTNKDMYTLMYTSIYVHIHVHTYMHTVAVLAFWSLL